MSTEELIRDLKEYFAEAYKKGWEDYIINFDLNRMITRYEDDFYDAVRYELEGEFRERLEKAQECVEEAIGYLDYEYLLAN